MAIQSAPLNLLTFSQHWTPRLAPQLSVLSLNIFVLPKGDPLENLKSTATAFADAELTFNAVIVPSLDKLPALTPDLERLPFNIVSPSWPPATRRELFQALSRRFKKRPGPPPGPAPKSLAVRKFLGVSYREATNYANPRTTYTSTDKSYECVLKDTKAPKQPPPKGEFRWEEVLAFVLRQPLLAEALGLVYRAEVPLDNNRFPQGGYLFVDLADDSDYFTETHTVPDPGLLVRFAARIPPLAEERALFTPVLFPITGAGTFDRVFEEAQIYDDGFARIVHGAQPRRAAQIDHDSGPLARGEMPPIKDVGIRLGWDDEQITIWLNRQFGTNAYDDGDSPNSPLGVAGYRVDVRDVTGVPNPDVIDWTSLCRVRGNLQVSKGPGDPGPAIPLGNFDGEFSVEAVPVNLSFNVEDGFWLPSYFASWSGSSLVLGDRTAFQIANQPQLVSSIYEPVGADAVPLLYGHTYQFRVRLMDLTGGGPTVDAKLENPAPVPVATVPFLRFVPPHAVRVGKGGGLLPGTRTARYEISRPLLGYPDAVFTGLPNAVNLLRAQAAQANAEEREPGLPDPDVTQVRIEVQARALNHDPAAVPGAGQWLSIYSVVRNFPAASDQPLVLNAQFEDITDIASLAAAPSGALDPLPLPAARNLRLVLTAMGENYARPYWGTPESREGVEPVSVYLRAPAVDERKMFRPAIAAPEIQAIFLQPDPPSPLAQAQRKPLTRLINENGSDLADRLAHQLALAHSGLTYAAESGQRLVIGASSALRHTLNPDRSSITFASKSDLTRHWIIAIRLRLDRDWTWDALDTPAFRVLRNGTAMGEIVLPRIVNASALANRQPDHTDILFMDGYDPKPPADPPFPRESHLEYQLVPLFRAAEPPEFKDDLKPWKLTLPITTPPLQTPKLISAGFAFSDYVHDDHYSSSQERKRVLYLEFDRPPLDPQDKYFARRLAQGPDPMIIGDVIVPDPVESPMPIDPEYIRTITEASSNDRAGLSSQIPELIISDKEKVRYVLPIPGDLTPDSPELFGFFVYEVVVGHDDSRWCTAQGRYGPPLRVAGVQHPAPQLRCAASRDSNGVSVSAPFASAGLNGVDVRSPVPKTALQALLYAQVMQSDGAAWRNVLLLTQAAPPFQEQVPGMPPAKQGRAFFTQDDILQTLDILGLPADSSLSVIAVELLPEATAAESGIHYPLTRNLGEVRILRTSPLTPVPEICPPH